MATSKELRAQADEIVKQAQVQAGELIKQAEALERKERDDARDAILALMKESGLTPEDILGKGSKGNSGNKANKGQRKSTGPVAAQFKDPNSDKTWSGRGRAPEWIAGKDREDFRIKMAA